MIGIDFVAGTHGNYLEFVLNKLTYGDLITQTTPFGLNGSSHGKDNLNYDTHRLFVCKHWFLGESFYGKKMISINFSIDSLLPIMSASILRAADLSVDTDQLHDNTFEKLNNTFYRDVLKNIKDSYGISLNSANPNCPRHILREFYKFGFIDPRSNGYFCAQDSMKYANDVEVFKYSYENFYDIERFCASIDELVDFYNIKSKFFYIRALHEQFLEYQPQRFYLDQCHKIIDAVNNKLEVPISNLSLLQESYINAKIELIYNKEMPFEQEEYFKNTLDIVKYLNI